MPQQSRIIHQIQYRPSCELARRRMAQMRLSLWWRRKTGDVWWAREVFEENNAAWRGCSFVWRLSLFVALVLQLDYKQTVSFVLARRLADAGGSSYTIQTHNWTAQAKKRVHTCRWVGPSEPEKTTRLFDAEISRNWTRRCYRKRIKRFSHRSTVPLLQ